MEARDELEFLGMLCPDDFFEWPRDKYACTQKKEEPFEGHCGYTHVIYLYIYIINHAART